MLPVPHFNNRVSLVSLVTGLLLCLCAIQLAGAQPRVDFVTLAAIETGLANGDPLHADSLRTTLPVNAPALGTQAGIILESRLEAARGDWRGARKRLENWLQAPSRTGSTGEVHFWLAWIALHQGELALADTLLVLASADTGSARALDALEYRFAALLENGPTLTEYLRGLPESPLPRHLRRASLENIPPGSRLYPHALWELARIARLENHTGDALEILQRLAAVPGLQGRRASAMLAHLEETGMAGTLEQAISRYENLLLQQQNGVQSDFSRRRLQQLRSPAP